MLRVSVDVANVGNMDGKEVILLFMTEKLGPAQETHFMLRRFQKVFVKAGALWTIFPI